MSVYLYILIGIIIVVAVVMILRGKK